MSLQGLYLQAHALANACLTRTQQTTDRWLLQIYNTEKEYYGNHPTAYNQWLVNRSYFKQSLTEIRSSVKGEFQAVMNHHLDPKNVFSEQNLKECRRFADEAFIASSKCTSCLVDYARKLCKHSETLTGSPPCKYDVVGLGSMARGEATPYSDLEFGYIFERKQADDYFVRLAMAMYFTLNNLGETPLKGFYLPEFIDNYGQKGREKLTRSRSILCLSSTSIK